MHVRTQCIICIINTALSILALDIALKAISLWVYSLLEIILLHNDYFFFLFYFFFPILALFWIMTYIFFPSRTCPVRTQFLFQVIEMKPCVTHLNICERQIQEEGEDWGQLPAQSAEIAPSMAALEDK